MSNCFKYVAGTTRLEDGEYLARLDEWEEGQLVTIKDGRAYKEGHQFIMYGFEWKRLDA